MTIFVLLSRIVCGGMLHPLDLEGERASECACELTCKRAINHSFNLFAENLFFLVSITFRSYIMTDVLDD